MTRLSRRTQLTVAAASAIGVLTGLVLILTLRTLVSSRERAAAAVLDGVLRQAQAERDGPLTAGDLAEIARPFPKVSISVSRLGREIARYGASATGSGGDSVRREGRSGAERIVVEYDAREARESERRLGYAFLALWPTTVALTAGAAWSAAGGMYRPLARMTEEAARMADERGSRLPVPDDPEFGPLARSFNATLERLEGNVLAQERFVADAGHELRTPLTILRGTFETSLLREREPEEYRRALRAGVEECTRLTALVNLLLRSASAPTLSAEALRVDEAAATSVERWRGRFEAKGADLDFDGSPCRAAIREEEFDAVLDNLLANALAHSPAGSRCEVAAGGIEGEALLTIADQGEGVPPEERERIFERLVRLDGPTSDRPGFGIGLAICRRLVTSRGGSIRVEENEPRGARFVVTLPVPPTK